MMVFVVGNGVSAGLVEVFACKPVSDYWEHIFLTERCINEPIFFYFGAGFIILEDLFVLVIPIPCISQLNMGLGKRFIVCIAFSLGLL